MKILYTIKNILLSLFKRKGITDDITNITNINSSIDSSRDILINISDYLKNETNISQPMYNDITILLDSGHARTTPGKRSPYSATGVLPELPFYEYEFNRELQSIIASKLKSLGIRVEIITPEVDYDVSLTERANRVNRIISNNPTNHHLFISVHSNACGNGSKWMSGRGFEVWTTKGRTNSDKFADCVYDAADYILKPKGILIRTDLADGDRDKESNFTVIYMAKCPSILTENLFYDNIEDCKFLSSNEGKNLLADVHVQGIVKYIEKYLK